MDIFFCSWKNDSIIQVYEFWYIKIFRFVSRGLCRSSYAWYTIYEYIGTWVWVWKSSSLMLYFFLPLLCVKAAKFSQISLQKVSIDMRAFLICMRNSVHLLVSTVYVHMTYSGKQKALHTMIYQVLEHFCWATSRVEKTSTTCKTSSSTTFFILPEYISCYDNSHCSSTFTDYQDIRTYIILVFTVFTLF